MANRNNRGQILIESLIAIMIMITLLVALNQIFNIKSKSQKQMNSIQNLSEVYKNKRSQ